MALTVAGLPSIAQPPADSSPSLASSDNSSLSLCRRDIFVKIRPESGNIKSETEIIKK
jgi:hypothetical protein